MIKRIEECGQIWYTKDNRHHRPNGPAYIGSNAYGVGWGWWLNGKRTRYYGPSNHQGAWWIHDKRIKIC